MIDVSLNVTSGGASAAGSVLRTNQAYYELLCDKYTLDGGIAFSCSQFPEYRAGQQLREVWVENADELAAVFDAAEAHFAEYDLTCARWALAEAQSPDMIEPVLSAHGFRREDTMALALAAWPEAPADDESIRILPARPMRAAYEACWHEATRYLPEPEREPTVDAAIERLDDHRMDAFVAQHNGKPAGIGALFQVGDIGRLVDFYVLPDHKRNGVGTALLQHAIAMARRLTMRIVCVEVSNQNSIAIAFLTKNGFVEAGRINEFHRENVVRPDYKVW